MAKILVIDDDTDLRGVIAEVLTELGDYEVVQAKNGQEGVKTAKEVMPDLIVCDVEMPLLDGYGVIAELQKDDSTSTIPFVFLTGTKDPNSNRKGMTLGADDYIAKPIQAIELLDAIDTRLSKSKALTGHYEQKMASLRESILYALPHEVRTPLSGIIGMAILLSDESTPMPHSEVVEYANIILESGNRLQTLLENYLSYIELDLISTDPRQMEMVRDEQECEPDQSVAAIVHEIAKKYGRSADLDLNTLGYTLSISTHHLQKVVHELVDNAFKFSSEEHVVSVKTEIKQNDFVLTIVNEGRGLTPNEIQEIGSFRQFERKTHEQQGVGLGLIIVHKIADLYEGEVIIHSLEGKSTTIEVLLPLASAQDKSANPIKCKQV